MHIQNRHIEKAVAVGSAITAAALAFTALLISEDHDIAAGACMVIAQFLLLTASIFGLDYKLGTFGSTSSAQNWKGGDNGAS